MNEQLLERIAVALEGMNEKLGGIEASLSMMEGVADEVNECIVENSYGKSLRIVGTVYGK